MTRPRISSARYRELAAKHSQITPRPTIAQFAMDNDVDPATLGKHVRSVKSAEDDQRSGADIDTSWRDRAAALLDEHKRLKRKYAAVLRAYNELAGID